MHIHTHIEYIDMIYTECICICYIYLIYTYTYTNIT